MRSNYGWVLLGALAVLLASGCRGRFSTEPPVHPNLNMDFQWKFEAQEPSEMFEDDRVMRPHIDGTVAHGTLAATDEGTEHLYDGMIGGKWTDELPEGLTLDQALILRGQDRYQIYCTPCHGSTGEGNGIVVARGMTQPQPFTEARLRQYPLGRIVWTLRYGKDNMPSYAAQIPVDDRWAIAAYVRALQIAQAAPAELVPADKRAGGN